MLFAEISKSAFKINLMHVDIQLLFFVYNSVMQISTCTYYVLNNINIVQKWFNLFYRSNYIFTTHYAYKLTVYQN